MVFRLILVNGIAKKLRLSRPQQCLAVKAALRRPGYNNAAASSEKFVCQFAQLRRF